jgi:hypothetical protein
MDCDVNLGSTPSKYADRDAVHVAVIPMIAGEKLLPGTHVSVVDGKCFASGNLVGIVDPYRAHHVIKEGESFWLCLYPKSVTSIRHHWTCPAIPASSKEEGAVDKLASERWLRAYAETVSPYYKEDGAAFTALIDGLKKGEVFYYGRDLHYFGDLNDADELRFHAERYLGIRINWDKFSFSCSC